MPTKYLTPNDVAEMRQCHYKTVALALREGHLHGFQSTGKNAHWRIREECAEAWIEGRPCEHKQRVTSIESKRRAS